MAVARSETLDDGQTSDAGESDVWRRRGGAEGGRGARDTL